MLAVLAVPSLFTVDQTEQVLITQFGEPVRVITEPGLHAKLPLMQTVISFDRRLLDYEVPPEEVILGDQRRLIVDSFTRFRIIDPLRYYQAVGPTEDGIRARLNSVVSSALRRVLGNEQLLNVLSSQRGRIMGLIRDQVNSEMRNFGVTVEDVRIRRADLPEENTQAVLTADEIRARARRHPGPRRGRGGVGAESAPTPSASAPCCWRDARARPTSCAARARRSRSRSTPTRSSATRSSFDHGGRCRPTGGLRRRQRAAGADAGRRLPEPAAASRPTPAAQPAVIVPRRHPR